MAKSTKNSLFNRINFSNHILRIILLSILSVFVGFSLFIFNSKTLLHDSKPTIFGFGVSNVISGSMEPTININDIIVFKQQDQYDIDDIVVYMEKDNSVVHRIVELSDDNKCITKGDANNIEDAPIYMQQIKGKVLLQIPFVGFLVNNVTKYVFLFIVIFLLALSFLGEAKNRKKDSEKATSLYEEILTLKNQIYEMQLTQQKSVNTKRQNNMLNNKKQIHHTNYSENNAQTNYDNYSQNSKEDIDKPINGNIKENKIKDNFNNEKMSNVSFSDLYGTYQKRKKKTNFYSTNINAAKKNFINSKRGYIEQKNELKNLKIKRNRKKSINNKKRYLSNTTKELNSYRDALLSEISKINK